MPDNINKTADSKELENKELDIEQLEKVSGGRIVREGTITTYNHYSDSTGEFVGNDSSKDK